MCLFAVSPGLLRGEAKPQLSHWEWEAGFGLEGGLCPELLGVLAAASSMPGLVSASRCPCAVPAEPPVGWEQLKGRKSRGSAPSPFSGLLLTRCPACWPPCGAGTPAGPVGRAGERKRG